AQEDGAVVVAEVAQEPPQPLRAAQRPVGHDEDAGLYPGSGSRRAEALRRRQRMASGVGDRQVGEVDVEEGRARDVACTVEVPSALGRAELPAAIDEAVAHRGIVSIRRSGYNAQWMRRRLLVVAGVVAGVGALAAGATAAARNAWPAPKIELSSGALVHVHIPRFGGRLAAVRVLTASGEAVPVRVDNGDVWPKRLLGQGERLFVEVLVRRPGWAGWIAGARVSRTLTVTPPSVRVRS